MEKTDDYFECHRRIRACDKRTAMFHPTVYLRGTHVSKWCSEEMLSCCLWIWHAVTVNKIRRTRQRCKYIQTHAAAGMIQPKYLWYDDDYLLIYFICKFYSAFSCRFAVPKSTAKFVRFDAINKSSYYFFFSLSSSSLKSKGAAFSGELSMKHKKKNRVQHFPFPFFVSGVRALFVLHTLVSHFSLDSLVFSLSLAFGKTHAPSQPTREREFGLMEIFRI